jgi:hypothetical protein
VSGGENYEQRQEHPGEALVEPGPHGPVPGPPDEAPDRGGPPAPGPGPEPEKEVGPPPERSLDEEVGAPRESSLGTILRDFKEPYPGYLDRIAGLYAEGHSVEQIARLTGRHKGTISRDLRRVRHAWSQLMLPESRETSLALRIARLEQIVAAATEAWEQSRKPLERYVARTFETQIPDPQHPGRRVNAVRKETMLVRTPRDGDPRFLAVKLNAERQLAGLQGVAPKDGTDPDNPAGLPTIISFAVVRAAPRDDGPLAPLAVEGVTLDAASDPAGRNGAAP